MACSAEISGRRRIRACGGLDPLARSSEDSWYQLEIPARIDSVGPLCAFLTVLCERHGLSTEEARCVEISAYETCLNIIEHAYGFDRSGRITVRVRFAENRVVLAFSDKGRGVDPGRIPPPDVADPRVRLRGRGFGLEIIRNSVDRMRYRKTSRGENTLLLVKLLPGRGTSNAAPGSTDWREGGEA
ncbi:MAG: ATP-binding protein [Candidatus Eisenbacteria bacterium]|nr:ATP-binding protein [Candidatus Eisenbacteria bacterium]